VTEPDPRYGPKLADLLADHGLAIQRGTSGAAGEAAEPEGAAPETGARTPQRAAPRAKRGAPERAAPATGRAAPAAIELIAIASRKPLAAAEVERLRARCRERAVALVALQSDAFLEALPEAALRISACDSTPLTRRVVARTLAARLREAFAIREVRT
jgi:hypothetical protein